MWLQMALFHCFNGRVIFHCVYIYHYVCIYTWNIPLCVYISLCMYIYMKYFTVCIYITMYVYIHEIFHCVYIYHYVCIYTWNIPLCVYISLCMYIYMKYFIVCMCEYVQYFVILKNFVKLSECPSCWTKWVEALTFFSPSIAVHLPSHMLCLCVSTVRLPSRRSFLRPQQSTCHRICCVSVSLWGFLPALLSPLPSSNVSSPFHAPWTHHIL